MAVAALVLGIVSIILSFSGYFAIGGLVTGIVGIVLGVRARKEEASGIATGGLVTSIIGTVMSAILFLTCVVCLGSMGCLAKNVVDDPTFKKSMEELSKDPNVKKSMDELSKGLKELEKSSNK